MPGPSDSDDLFQTLARARTTRVVAGAFIAASVVGSLAFAQQMGAGVAFEVIAMGVAFALGTGGSLLAEADRPQPRTGSALLAGAFVIVALVVRAMLSPPEISPPVSYIGIPLAGAIPFGARAWIHAPPTTFARVERLLEWAFAGAFWTSVIAVGVAFGLKYVTSTVGRAAIVAVAAGVLGAVYVHAMMVLDPDGPPAAEAGESAESADDL